MNTTFKAMIDAAALPMFDKDNYLGEYLTGAFENPEAGDTYLKGGVYLKSHLTPFLRDTLLNPDWWALKYADAQNKYIINSLHVELTPEQKAALGHWVYIWNDLLTQSEKTEEINTIKARGFREISGAEKELDGLKVVGVFSIKKIGIMGGYSNREEKTGRLMWCAGRTNCLMLIPKGSRTRGYFITDKAYIKELNA